MTGSSARRVARIVALALVVVLVQGLLSSHGTVLAQDAGSLASCLPGWSQGAAPSAERILRCVQEAGGAAAVFGNGVGDDLAADPTEPTPCQPPAAAPAPSEGPGAAAAPEPGPPAVAVPGAGGAAPAVVPAPGAARPAGPATAAFRLCGGDSSETARAIERFIAGRSFSARARSIGDGCLDLTLALTSASPAGGTQSSSLSVGTGRGQITVRLVSQDGQTSVSITDQPASGGRRDDG
jgi:hypothetical protein